jgi:hypothetical protein
MQVNSQRLEGGNNCSLLYVLTQYMFRTMRSRDHNVVLVRRTIKPGMLGIWSGEGMGRGWKGGGQFTSNLGPRWMGSYHIKEGFQVSKRKVGLEKEGISKGSKNKGFVP